jgi:TonB family protein
MPFWAWSTLLHVGIIALFSFIHFSNTIQNTASVVQVTLVESTSPGPTTAQTQPQREKASPKAPPLLQARRPAPPMPQHTIPTLQPLKTPTAHTTIAQVAVPLTRQKMITPLQRHVLRDNRATDQLHLKNYFKVAQRVPASRTTSQPIKPQLEVLSSSAALLTHMPSRNPAALTSRATPAIHRSLKPQVLKARAPGTSGISKSKVGFGRTILPVYPRIARETGWEGTVLVRVSVQPDESPDFIKVRKSSRHPVLDHAAVDAIKRWRFLPAKDGNIPIRSIVEIPINFDLKTTRLIEVMNKDLPP